MLFALNRSYANSVSHLEYSVMGEGGKVDGGLAAYYSTKIDQLELQLHDKMQDLKRLEAQRNDLNSRGECLLVCA